MKMFPGNPLGIGDPVLVTACVAAGGAALVQHSHVRGLRTRLEVGQLLLGIHLKTQMVQTRRVVATRGDGEIHAGIVQHPFGVVALHACWCCAKQLGIEGDVLGQIIDVQVDMKALHRELLQQWQDAAPAGVQAAP